MIFSIHTPYMPQPVDGRSERYTVEWPEDWPPPREGEDVMTAEGTTLIVRSVVWYPHPGMPDTDTQPFVHIVLAEHRPGRR